ncbi:MAG TPA: hypothetical protein VGG84_11495 [Gemmatimonadaceae bacterium]
MIDFISSTHVRRLVRHAYFIVTPIVGVFGIVAFSRTNQKPHFQEIDVERINIIEPNGMLRMTISDAARSPGWVFKGKPYPGRPKGAGMIFFNDEGEEDGGIGFGGRTVDGKVHAEGGLAFDQYGQDETVTLQYSENDGRRTSGLTITDRSDMPISEFLERRDAIRKMPAGAARDSAMQAFQYNNGRPLAARRVFAGRDPGKNAVVSLADPMGHPRLRLVVDSTGAPSILFLDASGNVTRTVNDSAQ